MPDENVQIYCAYDELVDVVALVPHPRNPNQHPAKQIELLSKIIKHQGWRAPITVSKRSGFMIRGHGRLMAAKHLGLTHVPVDMQDYQTEAEEWADLIADNVVTKLRHSAVRVGGGRDLLPVAKVAVRDGTLVPARVDGLGQALGGIPLELQRSPPFRGSYDVAGGVVG